MIRRSIEARLQNIIDLDKVKNKQLAIKTKVLNNKLQQYGESIGYGLERMLYRFYCFKFTFPFQKERSRRNNWTILRKHKYTRRRPR